MSWQKTWRCTALLVRPVELLSGVNLNDNYQYKKFEAGYSMNVRHPSLLPFEKENVIPINAENAQKISNYQSRLNTSSKGIEKKKVKTYKSEDSMVVTHPTTNSPACGYADKTSIKSIFSLVYKPFINEGSAGFTSSFLAKKLEARPARAMSLVALAQEDLIRSFYM